MGTVEYRPLETQKVSLFVGTGLGVAQLVGTTNSGDFERLPIGVAFQPRLGIQCWGHLRVYLEANITCDIYNTAALTLGWAF